MKHHRQDWIRPCLTRPSFRLFVVNEDPAEKTLGKVRYRNFRRQATNFTKLTPHSLIPRMFLPESAERHLSVHQFSLAHCARNTFLKALLRLNRELEGRCHAVLKFSSSTAATLVFLVHMYRLPQCNNVIKAHQLANIWGHESCSASTRVSG